MVGKRPALLFAAAVSAALTAFAGVASHAAATPPPAASPVVSARAASAPDPAGYWTPARMRAADEVSPPAPDWVPPGNVAINSALAADRGSPLEVPAAGPAAPAPAATASDTRPRAKFASGQVPDPAVPGLRMHGRVFFSIPGGGDAACSGTAISSNRRNLLLTAGHCVHGGGHTGTWVRNLVFVPAYEDGKAPFGVWRASRLYATPIWVEFGDATGDVAMATMRPNDAGELQDVVGARGVRFGHKVKSRYAAYGYPANPDDGFDGRTERFCRSKFAGFDPASRRGVGPRTISMRCDMTQGASGGSWIVKRRLAASVVSYGYPGKRPNRIYGPYFGSLARELYGAAQVRCQGRVATIVGTGKADRITGTRHRDVIAAGPGADRVTGAGKRDVICGGPGADRISGGAGADDLLGGAGKDRLSGGRGKDSCGGGSGRDRARGCESRRQVP